MEWDDTEIDTLDDWPYFPIGHHGRYEALALALSASLVSTPTLIPILIGLQLRDGRCVVEVWRRDWDMQGSGVRSEKGRDGTHARTLNYTFGIALAFLSPPLGPYSQ